MTDLTDPSCVDDVAELKEVLIERRIVLTGNWPAEEPDDAFALRLSTVLVASKCELMSNLDEELALFEELVGCDYPSLAVSTVTEEGLDGLGPFLFERLGVVRVYTKPPGGRPDLGRPFTVRRDQTVGDVARLIHKELAEGLRFAAPMAGRLRGTSDRPGPIPSRTGTSSSCICTRSSVGPN